MSDLELYEARSEFRRPGSGAVVVDLERIDDEMRQEVLNRNADRFAATYQPKPVTGLTDHDRKRLRGQADEALIRLRAALHEIPKTCERAAVAILDTIDIVDGLKRRIGNVA